MVQRERHRFTMEGVNLRARPIHAIVASYSEVGAMNIVKILKSEPLANVPQYLRPLAHVKFHVSENMPRSVAPS